MSAKTVIETHHLTKKYGTLTAVNDVSFAVSRGEIFAFLGPNGAGKTTTLEVLQCLRPPTSGEAEVLGFRVTDAQDSLQIKRRIGVLPQDFNALDRLTVQENISMFAAMYDHSRSPGELIRLLDLEDKAKTRFDRLSGGLKQRVGVAAALVNDPELIFLDEPTTGLDPKSRREVWQVIQGLKREGRTVFLTTHYMEEAERLADRVAVIHQGRIAAIGSTNDLLESHGGERTLFVEGVQPEQLERIRSEFPEVRQTDGEIAIPADNLDGTARVIELLGRLGLTRGIQIRNPSIENVFLKLIGAHLTEEGELA